MTLLVQKLRRKNCQNPFSAILRQKKIPTATKPRGGGKGLSGRPLKKEFFVASLTCLNNIHTHFLNGLGAVICG